MNVQPRGTLRRWWGRLWRFGTRHPVRAVLRFAMAIGVAGLVLLLAGQSMPGAGLVRVCQNVLLLLAPALLFGAVCYGPRGVRAVWRTVSNRRAQLDPQPSVPPIERIAADLRRLLWEHDKLVRSDAMPMRARRLWALEAAISDCATLAARALDVPHPDRPAHAGFGRPQLRRLLRALAAEGLALPPAAGLLAPDSRF